MYPFLWGLSHLAVLQGTSVDTHRTFSNKLYGRSWDCMNPHSFDTTLFNCLNYQWLFLNRFRCIECKCCCFVSFQSRIAEISKLPLQAAQKENGCFIFSPANAKFRGVWLKSVYIQRNMLLNKFIRRGYEQLKHIVGVMELQQSRVACFGICGLFQAVMTGTHTAGAVGGYSMRDIRPRDSAIHLCIAVIDRPESHVLMI